MSRNFLNLFLDRIHKTRLVVEIGLDPEKLGDLSPFIFIRNAIQGTHEHAAAYVLDFGSFLAYGPGGIQRLIDVREFVNQIESTIPVIMGDTGRLTTNTAHFAFEVCKADAMVTTIAPGTDYKTAYENYPDKGFFQFHSNENPQTLHQLHYTKGKAIIPTIVGGTMIGDDIHPLFLVAFEAEHTNNLLVKIGHEITYAPTLGKIEERARLYRSEVRSFCGNR